MEMIVDEANHFCFLASVVALRVIEGLCEGPSYPSMHAMLSRWAPVHQRTSMTAVSYNGAFVGTIATFALSGWLSTLTWLGGWPLAFYGAWQLFTGSFGGAVDTFLVFRF